MTDIPSEIPLEQPGLVALRKERERADELQRQLRDLQGKVQSSDVLASEVQQLRNSLVESESQKNKDLAETRAILQQKDDALNNLRIEQQFNRVAVNVRLNPVYQSLLLSANKSDFKVSDDGVVLTVDGKSIADWMEIQRSTLPELFDAPGISGSGSRTSRNINSGGKRVVSRDDSKVFMQNLDAIADGTVTTE